MRTLKFPGIGGIKSDRPMLVHHFLETSADRFPERPAVWYRGVWTTFGETNGLADKIARALKENGIGRGDRVALLYENSLDYIAAYYAVLKIGAVTVALNTDTTSAALSGFLNHSGSRALITQYRFESLAGPALAEAPGVELVIMDREHSRAGDGSAPRRRLTLKAIYDSAKANPQGFRMDDGDAASIVYTSGSTGRPKGVTLTHLNFVSNTKSIAEYLGLTPSDRIMVVLPFPYIYGLSLLNTHFFSGGSVVIDNRFTFPQAILETMQNTEVTGFAGVPSTYLILLHRSAVRKFRFPLLRYVTQAGGAMAPAVQKEVAQVFAPARLFVMYGATEAAARLSYLHPDMLARKWGSIGKPVPGVELFVADPEGRRLRPNEVGEIVARGPNIMAGYWKDPEATAQALRNGFYHTGDLGYEDDEGYLFITGRASDIIKPGGLRVSAKEVEDALYELEGVHEAAVVGVPDPVLGEAIKAFIVPKVENGLNADQVRRDLARNLPPYKIPKHIEFKRTLPRNESGKVLKALLPTD
jgi:long-chain acyl-CoA synthetase